MKQRIKRILACMLAIVAAFTAVFSNVTPAMAVSAEAALSYWDASAKDVGEVSEIKPDFYHGKILYGLIDGHSAYCMNFGLQAYGGQLMNSYENASTSMTAKQEKLLAYCMYFGYSAPDTNTPSSSQNDQFIATTILNARQKAEVSVIKKDEDTENGLSGGKYTLYADNNIRNYDGKVIVTKGTTLQEITTGAGGKGVYSLDLPVNNNFVIKETQAPANYYRNSKATYSFTFKSMTQDKAKATFSHTFKNKRTTAKIRVTKVDAEIGKQVPQGDALLKGAVYGLYARENIVHPDGVTGVLFKKNELVATLTTDDKGMADIADLYLGKYYVKEISPSEGYLLDETEYDIVCDYEGDMIPQVLRDAKSRERVIKQPFQLIKVSDDGKDTEADLLSGAGFTAYLKSALGKKTDGSYDFVNSSILSNAASMILIHNHPSGNLFPSKQDTIITDRMVKNCEIMGINLIDHIIVGGDNSRYFSFREKDMIKNPQIVLETDYRAIDMEPVLIAEDGKVR